MFFFCAAAVKSRYNGREIFGFVQFNNKDDAKAAIGELHNTVVAGMRIRVSFTEDTIPIRRSDRERSQRHSISLDELRHNRRIRSSESRGSAETRHSSEPADEHASQPAEPSAEHASEPAEPSAETSAPDESSNGPLFFVVFPFNYDHYDTEALSRMVGRAIMERLTGMKV